METQISVPVYTEQFIELFQFLRSKGDRRDPVMVIADAIDYWMQNADWKPELLRQSTGRGYQWKSIFLPDGTEVRMQYKGQYYYASVEDDQLMYQGDSTTPGRLANTIAGSSRNAWHDLWVKRPTDVEWHLADALRNADTSAQEG